MFEVEFLFASYKGNSNVCLGLEIEMPKRSRMLRIVVVCRSWEWALAPIDTGDVIRELGDVGMGYHSPDIMSDEMNLVLDANMLCDQLV